MMFLFFLLSCFSARGGGFLPIICWADIVGWIESSLIISHHRDSNLLISFVYQHRAEDAHEPVTDSKLHSWTFSIWSMFTCAFGPVSLCPFRDVDTSVGVSCADWFILIGCDEQIQILLTPLFANYLAAKIDARMNTCVRRNKGKRRRLLRECSLWPPWTRRSPFDLGTREWCWCGGQRSYLKPNVEKRHPPMNWMAELQKPSV